MKHEKGTVFLKKLYFLRKFPIMISKNKLKMPDSILKMEVSYISGPFS
jgi:hypothetical protein